MSSYNSYRDRVNKYASRCCCEYQVPVRYFLPLLILMWCFTCALHGETYGPFEDLLDMDRAGVIFTDVRKVNSVKEDVAVTVWTRISDDELRARTARNLNLAAQPSLLPGKVRTLFKTEVRGYPAIVRTSASAVALVDYFGLNAAPLKDGPAVQLFSFDGKLHVSCKLDEIFTDGWRRYHNDLGFGGSLNWLHDAWFDQSGRRLLVVSAKARAGEGIREVAIIDLDSGKVEAMDNAEITRQLATVEKRFLHVAFDLAASRSVEGINKVAEAIFLAKDSPLPARLYAACYLEERGNRSAAKLLTEVASLETLEPKDIQHAMVPTEAAYDDEYWWKTIGFAGMHRRAKPDFETHTPPTSTANPE